MLEMLEQSRSKVDWENVGAELEQGGKENGIWQEYAECTCIIVEIICKWEHQMKQWMEAYGVAWGAKDAQMQVKKFSSRCYMSHRRVSMCVAAALDA